ncbi:tyrosine-type recombinase/integrase [Kribbella amoyensis]|uniref:tyrosine-type recombinase/integrase n=1 Tax=Kribbella amoyensis TaxID=996641 RepID=UPI001478494D|nr:site-specific integrase [Kribbella amoyensis]
MLLGSLTWGSRFGPSTARAAFLVLHGTLELAVDDEAIKRNPAKARGVKVPTEKSGRTVVWSDDVVLRIAEGHPPEYRPIASIGAACGLRQGELFGLAGEDIDFGEMVIQVRRQVKKLGSEFVFALPKNDTERTVPMSDGTALILKEHIEATKPRPYTLPWEKLDGDALTVRLLFRWTDDKHIRARTYDELVWKPALSPRRRYPEADEGRATQTALRLQPRERDARVAPLLREHHARRRCQYQGVGCVPGPRRSRFHPAALHPHAALVVRAGAEGCGLQTLSPVLSQISRSSHGAGRRTLSHYLLGAGRRPVPRPASNHRLTCTNTYLMRMPEIARAITNLWISEVPSKMV